MTAEIALMTKTALALAADSAVTLSGGKVYNSVNKLFMLSKYEPIGIMIYGNAEINGTPLETVIKEYRRVLNNKRFSHVNDYCLDFVNFLGDCNIFTSEAKDDNLILHIASFFTSIRNEIIQEAKNTITLQGNITQKEIKSIIHRCLTEAYQFLNSLEDFTGKLNRKEINKLYKAVIDEVLTDTFERLPLNKTLRRLLHQIAALLITKNFIPDAGLTGIVIGGFGEDDYYPAIYEYQTCGTINSSLKINHAKVHKITHRKSAAIIPFAQKEMVITFMEGLDPSLHQVIDKSLQAFFSVYTNTMLDIISHNTPADNLIEPLEELQKLLLEDFNKQLYDRIREYYVNPVLNIIDALPKDELAEAAEALVNLTSFKRRVSTDKETVGGPIDVAIISKGDGFVWIKRKHYFKADFNNHFLSNYFQC